MLSPASETNTVDHINAGRRPPASRDARRRGSRRDHMMNRRDVFCENRRRASACCARERATNGREWNGDGVPCGASSKAAVSGCTACSGSPWTRAARERRRRDEATKKGEEGGGEGGAHRRPCSSFMYDISGFRSAHDTSKAISRRTTPDPRINHRGRTQDLDERLHKDRNNERTPSTAAPRRKR